jgi:hypothetical protein
MTDELRTRTAPINTAFKQVLKEREDRLNARKRDNAALNVENEPGERIAEAQSLDKIVRDNGLDEAGINPSGLYELCGALASRDLR